MNGAETTTFPVSSVFQSSIPHHGSPGSLTERPQSGLPMVQFFVFARLIPRTSKFQMLYLFVLFCFLDWSSIALTFVILTGCMNMHQQNRKVCKRCHSVLSTWWPYGYNPCRIWNKSPQSAHRYPRSSRRTTLVGIQAMAGQRLHMRWGFLSHA